MISKNTIILIGPCGIGKTTLGKLLSQYTGKPFYNLDEHEPRYSASNGFDLEKAHYIKDQQGFFTYYEYCRQFFDTAVEAFLEEFPGAILELGGGHPINPDPTKQERIKTFLQPYHNVFLILPVSDVEQSLQILRKRNQCTADEDLNELIFKDTSFFDMAKRIIYTDGKTPEESAKKIWKYM